jgi:hypothetical protein
MCHRHAPTIERAASRQNRYTQRSIERRIKAAQKCGLKVAAILPDGTVLTKDGDKWVTIDATPLTDRPVLRDAREKLGVY